MENVSVDINSLLDTSKWSRTGKTYDLAYIKGKYRLSDEEAVGIILKYLKPEVHYGADGIYKIGLIQLGRDLNRKHKSITGVKDTDESVKANIGSISVGGSRIVSMDFVVNPINGSVSGGNDVLVDDLAFNEGTGISIESDKVEMDLEDIFSEVKEEKCVVYEQPIEQEKEEKKEEEQNIAPVIEFNKEGRILETLQVCLAKPPNKRRIWVKRASDQHGVKLVCNVSELNYHGLKAGTEIVCEKIEDGLYVYPPIE